MASLEADVAIIGGGPAGIASALKLLSRRERIRVVLIDSGRKFRKRYCPVDHAGACNGCKGICNVICGFGGSVHYGDAIKLSKFPSGAQLASILGVQADDDIEEALRLLFGKPLFRSCRDGNGLVVGDKDYPVAVLRRHEVQLAIENWWRVLSDSPWLTMRFGTSVEQIDEHIERFAVRCRTLSGGELVVYAPNVFVGVGRKGLGWWRDEVRRLGLEFSEPVASLGLRFECPNKFVSAAAGSHADLKLQFRHGGRKFKTFCLCGSERSEAGGRIKFTDYGDFTLLDGHIEPDFEEAVANFAILMQLTDDAGIPMGFDWIRDNILRAYAKLRPDSPGKPVVQWYPDFEKSQITCASLACLQKRTGFRTTVSDYSVANIAGILSPHIHEGFLQAVREFGSRMGWLDTGNSRRAFEQVAVIGLELEKMWDVLALSPTMMTSMRGLHAIGDCAGAAQGILQAAASGIAATRALG